MGLLQTLENLAGSVSHGVGNDVQGIRNLVGDLAAGGIVAAQHPQQVVINPVAQGLSQAYHTFTGTPQSDSNLIMHPQAVQGQYFGKKMAPLQQDWTGGGPSIRNAQGLWGDHTVWGNPMGQGSNLSFPAPDMTSPFSTYSHAQWNVDQPAPGFHYPGSPMTSHINTAPAPANWLIKTPTEI